MFLNIPRDINSKLWKHQVDALNFAVARLNEQETPILIRMPTGTGKTGIIACLSMLSNPGSTLVLTPWAHLRSQMVTDLLNDFWNAINANPERKEVVELFPSTANEVLKINSPLVIISTFATINELRLEKKDLYQVLAEKISLVIVDEGHYEPAVGWGRSVKELNTKTLLLTATPYRNDLKLFRIINPSESTFHYTHKDAVENKIIRDLRHEELTCDPNIESLSRLFSEKWKAIKESKNLPSLEPKAIICCSGANDIETTVNLLRETGLNAIGIHEQFEKNDSEYLVKEVPNTIETDAEIWVHQHKLTEGLDDNKFCCISLFTRIRNDRKLIQQIGRILRKDKNDRNSPALVWSPPIFSPETAWNNYLEFEPNLELLEPKHFQEVVNSILDSQPPIEYFEGHFRRRFDPSRLSENPQVIIPPSVLVRCVSTDFSLSEYIEYCTDTLNTEDAVILGPDINSPCIRTSTYALWVYASVHNSRNLKNASLYEVKLETHCVVFVDSLVFLADTQGIYPNEYIEKHTFSISNEQITRFLDTNFSPTQVSLSNSIPYDTVARGIDLRGHNLLNIPSSLTDHVQICRSVRGSSKDYGRRYLGLMKGRVKQELSQDKFHGFDLASFVSWVNNLAKILNSTAKQNDLFFRYMQTCTPPQNPIPKTISLDLFDDNLAITLADGLDCKLIKSSSELECNQNPNSVLFTCSFNFETENNQYKSIKIKVEYQNEKQRFWFNKVEGASVRITRMSEGEESMKSFVDFLNQNQELLIIGLDDGEIVYQGRNFYRVDYSYSEKVLFDLIKRLDSDCSCISEKGSKQEILALKQSQDKTFPNKSLFQSIAERKFSLPFEDKLLICDDLGSECADFIAANFENRQLAFIHAKAGEGTKISASAFHEVVAQAMKNLVYLTGNYEAPDGIDSWSTESTWNNTHIPRLYRSDDGLPEKALLWKKIKNEIIKTSNPEIFVILLTTGCCDQKELREAINDPQKRTPETAQLLHLLDGLHGYSRQLGIRLIIYDLPFLG